MSWADRCAYCAHDLEDAAGIGIVDVADLPADRRRRRRAHPLVPAPVLHNCARRLHHHDRGDRDAPTLRQRPGPLRAFNYERIYTPAELVAQGRAVIAVLSALVEYFAENPGKLSGPAASGDLTGAVLPSGHGAALRRAIAYVSGMTDRFAFETAVELLGWPADRLPHSVAG